MDLLLVRLLSKVRKESVMPLQIDQHCLVRTRIIRTPVVRTNCVALIVRSSGFSKTLLRAEHEEPLML